MKQGTNCGRMLFDWSFDNRPEIQDCQSLSEVLKKPYERQWSGVLLQNCCQGIRRTIIRVIRSILGKSDIGKERLAKSDTGGCLWTWL
jgi:hypothetical protein